MYYNAEEIDQGLSCSFCRKQFVDVVKLLPGCGESICGECYEDLLDQTSENRQFCCHACYENHEMPDKELLDNKGLLRMLKRRKIERPLSEQAKTLKSLVKSVQDQQKALESFDKKDYVHSYCDQLELQVIEAISSVVKDLNEIEADLLKEIKQYREKCLNALTLESTVKSFEQELTVLSKEVDQFSAKWDQFFDRIDVLASDAEVDLGLDKVRELEKRIKSMDERNRKEALEGKRLVVEEKPLMVSKCHMKLAFDLCIYEEPEFKFAEEPSLTFDKHSGEIYNVIFLPGGNLASSSSSGTIAIWDAVKGDIIVESNKEATDGYAMCLLSDGSLASTCKKDYKIIIWNLDQLKKIRSIGDHAQVIVSLGVLKSGHLASYSNDNTIKIWNPSLPDKNLLVTITGHGNTYWIAQLFTVLPNDNVAACSRDDDDQEESILRVWNSRDGQLIKSIPTGYKCVTSVSALSDEQVAIGLDNGTIKIVDLTDDTKSRVKVNAHLVQVTSLVALSNGDLISAGEDSIYCSGVEFDLDHRIKFWSLPDFNLLQSIQTNHTYTIESLSISPDKKLLVSVDRDSIIKLWPLKA